MPACFDHNSSSTAVFVDLPDGHTVQLHFCATRNHPNRRLILELLREIDLQTVVVVSGIDLSALSPSLWSNFPNQYAQIRTTQMQEMQKRRR
jgi:hypothetical protein